MYELYSWQEAGGSWNFCMLPSPSGVNVTTKQVFSPQCRIAGLRNLKKRVSELPEHAKVFWLDHVWNSDERDERYAKGRKLRFPPSNVITDVEHEAEHHGVELQMAPLISL